MNKTKRFLGKKVLVTGATRGIGYAIAQAFHNEGAKVAINGRSQQSVNYALRTISNAFPAPGNLEKVSECKKVLESVIEAFDGLDILVNNAGIFARSSIENTDEKVWDKIMNVNVRSVQFCTKSALAALRFSKGCIVNIASESGLNGFPETSAYCASKGAVVNLTRSLAMELAPDIRVNALCPGVIETDMTREGFAVDGNQEEGIKRQHDAYPLKRIGLLREAAAATLFLASEEAGFINGAALPMEGGSTVGKW